MFSLLHQNPLFASESGGESITSSIFKTGGVTPVDADSYETFNDTIVYDGGSTMPADAFMDLIEEVDGGYESLYNEDPIEKIMSEKPRVAAAISESVVADAPASTPMSPTTGSSESSHQYIVLDVDEKVLGLLGIM